MATTQSQPIENPSTTGSGSSDFVWRAKADQERLAPALKSDYDVVVCGAGSSGSVVAPRIAENPDVTVLLLELVVTTTFPCAEPRLWPTNLGTDRDWGFVAEANPRLNNRAIPMSMGRVLGGGSSINVMYWARGHKVDWELFASESGNPAWSYASVVDVYRRIENWTGTPDPTRRGSGGLVHVQPLRTRKSLLAVDRWLLPEM